MDMLTIFPPRYKKDLIKTVEERGEFAKLEDGYVYYFPTKEYGALQSHELKIIAGELDKRNESWNKEIREILNKRKVLEDKKWDELYKSETDPLLLKPDKPQSKLILIIPLLIWVLLLLFWIGVALMIINLS